MASSPTNISYGSDNPSAPDIPSARRKRGEELEQAIRDATVAELADCGYGELSIEAIASRAQTGKASIYRRWPTKQDLVADALVGLCSGPLAFASDAVTDEEISTRDALFQVLTRISALMSGPASSAMRAAWSEAIRDSHFGKLIDEAFFEPRRSTMNALLARGVERGEVRPDVNPEFLHDVLGGALSNRILLRGKIPNEADLAAFLDDFVMPAIQPRS